MSDSLKIMKECVIGNNTKVYDFVNLYGCTIGDDCTVGPFVEIQQGVKIGNKVKVQSHTFICEGVTINDHVFIGHHVVFTNDKFPRSVTEEGKVKKQDDWQVDRTVVEKNASIGSNATIIGGVTIGENALIGAGSVVTKDVPKFAVVAGNPAKVLRYLT
jgi:UDP-2-acetamido-3-amino-2,3-dideoxy-glucuronate N-acetyltransferase